MATQHNFRIKNGLEVGGVLIVNSSGQLQAASISGAISATSIGVTNIVTNKVVKFNGSILDDSNITDTGSLITLGSNTTVSGTISSGAITSTGLVTSVGGVINTNTGSNPFYVTRSGATNQALKIYTDDAGAVFESIQDETADNYGTFIFAMDSGTTEPFFDVRKGTAASGSKFRVDGSGALQVGSSNTTFLDASLNLTNIGTISSGAITSSGSLTLSSNGISVNTRSLLARDTNGLNIGTTNATTAISIDNSANVTMPYNLTVSGNLTINGTTTTLNTATLDVEDKNITLNYGAGDTSGSANGAGITIQDAVNSTTDATILWNAGSDQFDFSNKINVSGDLQASNIYALDVHVLNAAGNGWHEWATRNNNKVDLNVGTISSGILSVNGGTTNVVATFQSTDGTAGIKLQDSAGNVELSASGSTFQVQPSGGSAVFTVNSSGNASFSGTVTATGGNSTNWNTAYGWGNHASAGYITDGNTNWNNSYGFITNTSGTAKGTGNNYVASSTSTSNRGNYGAGVWAYSGYSTGSNRPFTYDSTLQVMPASNMGFELSTDWHSSSGQLKIRSLRDCCQGWSTYSTVWTSASDGSGSGLDADLLDGQQGSYYYSSANPPPTYSKYLRSDTADTGSGKITLTATEGLQVGGIRGRAIGSQSGDFIQLYERVNIGYPSGWGATGANAPQQGLSTHGGAQFNTGNVSGAPFTFNSNTIWHAGNDGSGSGLDADLLDGQHGSYYYSSANPPPGEADTLATVTARGASTSTALTFNADTVHSQIRFTGVSGNSGVAHDGYAIYQEAGSWTHPYPDLIIGYHTGIKIGGHTSYGGTRFYNNNPSNGSIIASIGNGDNHLRGYHEGYLRHGGSTDNKIWTAGNDGAGSGLDADLLDGQHGSYYYAASNPSGYTTYTANQSLNTTNSPTFANLNTTNTGYVGIGDDIRIKDVSMANTAGIVGQQNNDRGYLTFGNNTTQLGRIGTGALTWGGNTIWHSGNDGAGSGLDADTIDGFSRINHFGVGEFQNFSVGGDADTWYPVVISGGGDAQVSNFQVYRGYGETAPSTWNNSTHMGGLSFKYSIVGSSGWGGYPTSIRVQEFGEIYSRVLGGIAFTAHTMKHVVWLRGGTANYHIYSDSDISVEVNDSTSASNYVSASPHKWYSYDNSNNAYDVTVSERTSAQADSGVANEVYLNMPVQYNSAGTPSVYGIATSSFNHKFWNSSNDGSGSGLDADLLDGQHGSYYYSSANPPPGDISGVTAGTGMTGGGTSGAVTLNVIGGSGITANADDITVDSTVIRTTGDQSIDGIKTFTGTNVSIDNPVNTWKYIRLKSGSTTKWDIATNEADDSSSLQFRAGGGGTNRVTVSQAGNLTATGTVTATGGNSTNWNTAYGWGNHASAGYLTSSSTQAKYLRSDTDDTMNGNLTIDSSSAWNAGNGMLNVGGTGDGRLQVRHIWGKSSSSAGEDHLWLNYSSSNKHVQIGTTGGGNNLYVADEIYAGGYFGGNIVWNAGNDGSGSGLDADTVDGKHATDLLHYRGIVSGDWDTIFTTGTGKTNTSGLYQVQNLASGHSNHPTGVYTYGGVLAWQLANSTFKLYSSHTGDLAFQSGWSNDEYSGWRRILTSSYYGAAWTSANDGSGSGLDADLLDGQHGSYYQPAGSYLTAETLSSTNAVTVTGTKYWQPAGSATSPLGGGGGASLQASTTGTTAAYMAFHRHGAYAINWGLDTSNAMVLGGWSSSTTVPRMSIGTNGLMVTAGQGNLWGASNDGSGSGLDADLLDGQHGSYYAPGSGGNYWPTSGSWAASNMPGSRARGTADNGGEVVILQDNPSSGRSSILVDGQYYAGENGGFYSLYSGNNYNNKAGFNTDTSGHLQFSSQTYAQFNTQYGNIQLGPMNGSYAHIYTNLGGGFYFNRTLLYADGNTMWHAGNDGSGSGLDADLLDGYNAVEGATANTIVKRDGSASIKAHGLSLMRQSTATTGISWYNESYYNWQDYMAAPGATSCGPNGNLTAPTGLAGVTSWALRSRMEGVSTYGWNWETGSGGGGAATATSKMSLNATTGNLALVGTMSASGFYDQNTSGFYVDPASSTNLQSVTSTPALKVTQTSGGGNLIGSLFQNATGNFAWGCIAEYRIAAATGTDRPSIIFSSAFNTDTWTTGFGFTDSNFRIKKDHGHRNGGWGTALMTMDRSGNVTFAGNVTAYSDERLKTEIKTIENPLDTISKLRGVTFKWKESGDDSMGVIAQEVEAIAETKCLVSETPEDGNGDINPKNVAYGNMVGLLIEGMKEQQTVINRLVQDIKDLKAQIK